jgi:hypothetical protein
MNLKHELGKALHDDPIAKLRAADQERRRNSPKAKLLERHDAEMRELQQRHARQGNELANDHAIKRGREAMLSTPKPYRFEEKLRSERDALRGKQTKEREALINKHDREHDRLGKHV